MQNLEIIILAAGKGTRMNSDEPKVLTEVNGKPMIHYLLTTLKNINTKPVIVLGYKADCVKAKIGHNFKFAIQTEQLGTGHAVHTAIPHINADTKHVMVLYGDQPLITAETIKKIYNSHISQNKSPLTLGTVSVTDFADWRKPFYDFGRIIRNKDGKIVKNTEKKDATDAELQITEVNPSFFCYNLDWLKENIKNIGKKNNQGEYYLTDLVGMAQEQGFELNSINIPEQEALGINNVEQLELVSKFIK